MADQQQDFAWLPLKAVRPWAKNPRKNDSAVGPVAESMRRFGFVAPVVIWPSADRLVAGHTRLKALEKLLKADPGFVPRGAPGPGLVPVRFQEFGGEAEASAYALADNRLGEIASWDDEALPDVLRSVQERDAELIRLAGWSDEELLRLLGGDGGAAEGGTGADPGAGRYKEQYGVIVICEGEAHQQQVYEALRAQGHECKVVVT